MVILRLDGRIRMVTKGYRKGVYDWVGLVKVWTVWGQPLRLSGEQSSKRSCCRGPAVSELGRAHAREH